VVAVLGRGADLTLAGVLDVGADVGAGVEAREVEEVLLDHAPAARVLHADVPLVGSWLADASGARRALPSVKV